MSQQVINVGAAPNDGTGDPIRTAFTKANANFTDLYSVYPISASSTRAQIQTAMNALGAAGGGRLVVGPGTVNLDSTSLVPVDGVVLEGSGMGVTIFKQTVTGVRAFSLTGSFNAYNYIAFADFTVLGTWLGNQSLGTDSDRPFAVSGVKYLKYTNIEVLYSRQMSITSNYCQTIWASGCRVQYSARDAFNFSGSNRCLVEDNTVTNCNDDAIAIHQEAAGGNPPNEGHVISNNTIEDSYGIKVLGAAKCNISNNNLRRVKGYGIYTSINSTEGYPDSVAVNLIGNTITDVINGSKFGAGSIACGIFLGSNATNYVAPVTFGSPPTFNYPEADYYISNGPSATNAGGQGYNIVGNVIMGFTLPAVSTYSTWGFGQAFTASGFVDPDLSTGFKFSSLGISFTGAFLHVNVSGNTFVGLSSCIQAASNITALNKLDIRNNVFHRYSIYAVSLETTSQLYGRCVIEGNSFDADPYFESSNRTSPLDGTWSTSALFPSVVDCVKYKGITVRNNLFRNMVRVEHSASTGASSYDGNTYYMQPDSTATVSSPAVAANKGIYQPDGFGHFSDRLVWEDSNPQSSTYGQELGRSAGKSSNIPTSGYYMTGQTVLGASLTTTGTPQYLVLGWRRMTTGNAQVLNTDWRELQVLDGL